PGRRRWHWRSRCFRSTPIWRSTRTSGAGFSCCWSRCTPVPCWRRKLPMRPPISAVVTTFNNAGTLPACLESLRFCDEIVLLDSGSDDASRSIAENYSARVFIEPFKGYSAQKQSAIDKAAHDWVLLLDADE